MEMFEEIYKKPEYYFMNDFQNVQRNCTVAYVKVAEDS